MRYRLHCIGFLRSSLVEGLASYRQLWPLLLSDIYLPSDQRSAHRQKHDKWVYLKLYPTFKSLSWFNRLDVETSMLNDYTNTLQRICFTGPGLRTTVLTGLSKNQKTQKKWQKGQPKSCSTSVCWLVSLQNYYGVHTVSVVLFIVTRWRSFSKINYLQIYRT